MAITSDIEIGISVESLADHFLISPNALHRGEDEYATLTLHERGMLAALLTLRAGDGRQWNTSRSGVNAIAPELGRDKISSILKGLREKRYLYTRRVNVGAGRFRWEWRVYMKARPDGFDPFAADVPTIDGTAVDGEPVNVPEQRKANVSAGHTIDGSLGPKDPSIKEGRSSRSTRSTSPLPPAAPAPAIVAGPTTGGEETDQETAAITDAIGHQPTWRPVAVQAAIRQAIANGLPVDVAHRVIVDLARGDTYGPTTAGPQRILAAGPWWTPGAVFVPAPPKDTRAMCERHPGQIAGSCSCCKGERLGAAPTDPTTTTTTRTAPPTAARDLLAGIPALQRARGRRCRPDATSPRGGQQQPTPSQV